MKSQNWKIVHNWVSLIIEAFATHLHYSRKTLDAFIRIDRQVLQRPHLKKVVLSHQKVQTVSAESVEDQSVYSVGRIW